MFIHLDGHRILVFSSEKHKRAAVRRKTWQRVPHSVRVGTVLVPRGRVNSRSIAWAKQKSFCPPYMNSIVKPLRLRNQAMHRIFERPNEGVRIQQ